MSDTSKDAVSDEVQVRSDRKGRVLGKLDGEQAPSAALRLPTFKSCECRSSAAGSGLVVGSATVDADPMPYIGLQRVLERKTWGDSCIAEVEDARRSGVCMTADRAIGSARVIRQSNEFGFNTRQLSRFRATLWRESGLGDSWWVPKGLAARSGMNGCHRSRRVRSLGPRSRDVVRHWLQGNDPLVANVEAQGVPEPEWI